MTDVLENYGICSQTEVSELEQDDISVLGLKPFHVKKLKRLSETVGACAEEMLPSSSSVPPAVFPEQTS